MQSLNLGLRFLLELCALFIYGYWGYKVGSGYLFKIGLGLGIPIVIAIIWSFMGSPKAPIQLSHINSLLFELILFGLPIFLLVFIGKPIWSAIYGTVFLINKSLCIYGISSFDCSRIMDQVQTYIQSGNVLFQSEKGEESLRLTKAGTDETKKFIGFLQEELEKF